MSEEQKQKIDSGHYVVVPKWEYYLRYASLVGVLYLIVKIGSWTTNIETAINNHIGDNNEHRSLREAQSEFVTRREFELSLKNIESSLQAIKTQVQK